jgi:hypothetical protein
MILPAELLRKERLTNSVICVWVNNACVSAKVNTLH